MQQNRPNDPTDFVPEGGQNDTSIIDILAIVMKQRRWFMLSVVVCLAAGVLYIKSTPKEYSRTATVLVKDDKKSSTGGSAAAFQDIFSLGTSSVENEMGILKSKRLMQKVTDRLHLEVSYRERHGLRMTQLYSEAPIVVVFPDALPQQKISMRIKMLDGGRVEIYKLTADDETFADTYTTTLSDTIHTPAGRLLVLPNFYLGNEETGRVIEVVKSGSKLVSDRYNNMLNVALSSKQSSLINLSITDENKHRAEDVLNTLIEVYKEDAIEDKNRVAVQTANFVNERLEVIEDELSVVDGEIEDYLKRNRVTDIVSESSLVLQSTGQLDAQGLNVENQLQMAKYMRDYLHDASKSAELIPASIGITDTGIQALITEYNLVFTRRDRLIASGSANNPLVKDYNSNLASMRASILKALDNLISGLEIQTQNMRAREQENMNKIAHVPTQQKYVASVKRQQTIKEELYLYLLQKKEENELQQSVTESNIRVVDPADGTEAPVAPRSMMVMLAAFMLGLILPGIWFYLRSLFDTKVKSRRELKSSVNIPFVGEIPYERQIDTGHQVVVREGSRDSISEAFKIVRDNIDFMATGNVAGRGRVIQLTSSNPNSGKTFISLNMGMSIALTNARVVVVDIDLRKGALTKSAEIGTAHAGVSTYLSGKVDDTTLLVCRNGEGRQPDIIPSGPLPPNPAELLKSNRFEQFIDELRQRYDYILMDNPPYGVVVDASLCARVADNTVYVVRSGLFDRRALPELQELYDTQKFGHMCLLLNA
ncbi:MAG: polysaccharide biosynthesis tyrosine autokinase, partial [Prevotellaceae bacterium]|nr:polysaccharide biosynthesis tyrosine autokinase [Prevotellaceae bacterium]